MQRCTYNDSLVCTQCGHVASVSGLVRNCRAVPEKAAIVVHQQHPTIDDVANAKFFEAKSLEELHGSFGPGTELKKLLAGWPFYISESEGCRCGSRAAAMDQNEAASPGWCEENIDEIVGWLREEAGRRNLPFVDAVGRWLVNRAIKKARKATIK